MTAKKAKKMNWRKIILHGTKKRQAKRSGRGISAGRGKTAGRGTKGQKARGRVATVGFEGGQTPLFSRLPKHHGMPNKFKKFQVKTITLDMLSRKFSDGDRVDAKALKKVGLLAKGQKAKLVNSGKLNKKLRIFLPLSSSLAKSLGKPTKENKKNHKAFQRAVRKPKV